MFKKQWIPGMNCQFHLAKGGRLTIVPTSMNFTGIDLKRTYDMAQEHAKQKKLKRPVVMNRIEIAAVMTS